MSSPIVHSGPGRPLRRLPGAGGVVIAVTVGILLSASSRDDVGRVLALAGIPARMTPATFAVLAGIVTGVVGWAILYLVWGPRGWLDAPRRPRATVRRPLSYADLGPPPPREQPLPVDLDQPLSAFDPDALDFYQQRTR